MEFKGRFQSLLGRVLRRENPCMGRLKRKGQGTYNICMVSCHKVESNELGILEWEAPLQLIPLCSWWPYHIQAAGAQGRALTDSGVGVWAGIQQSLGLLVVRGNRVR